MALEAIGLQAVLQDANFQAGLKRYQSGVGQMEKSTDSAAGMLTRLGSIASGAVVIGIGAATAAFAGAVAIAKAGLDATMQWAEQLDKLGDLFGMSGEQASGWAFLMNKVGLTVDEGAQGLNFFTKNLDDLKNANVGASSTTAKSADEIASLNQRLDDANVRLQRAQKAFSESKKPTDSMRYAVEDAQKAVGRLNAELGAATQIVPAAAAKLSPFGEALKKLGVSAYDSKGKMKDFDTIMPEIMDKFQKLPAGVNASALAMDLFGARGGSKFLDFLRQGGAGLKDATARAKALGLTLSTEEVNAAEQFGFSLNEMGLGLLGVKNTIGKALLPIAKELVDWINKHGIPMLESIAKDFGPKLADFFDRFAYVLGDFYSLVQGNQDVIDFFAADLASLGNLFGLDGKVVETFTRDFLHKLFDTLTRLGNWFRDTGLPWIRRFGDAFKREGLAGVLQEAGNLVGALLDQLRKAWPQISATLRGWGSRFWNWITQVALPAGQARVGAIAVAVAGWLAQNWPTISGQLGTWATQFWGWLTGKGGVTSQVGDKVGAAVGAIKDWLGDSKNTQPIWTALTGWGNLFWGWVTDPTGVIATTAGNLVNVITAAAGWLKDVKNTQPIWDAVGAWAGQFWWWITDPKSGVVITVADNMTKLTEAIKTWTELPETQKQLRDFGRDMAQKIIDGIGSLFDDQGKGDNLMLRFIATMNNAKNNMFQSIKNIGISVATGVIEGIVGIFLDDATAKRVADFLGLVLNKAVDLIIATSLPGIAARLWDALINYLTGGGAPTAPASTGAPTGLTPGILPTMQRGGYVPRDLTARLHRGEYVLPASTVNRIVNNNIRTIGAGAVVINLPAGSALTPGEVEDVAYRAIRRVMVRAA